MAKTGIFQLDEVTFPASRAEFQPLVVQSFLDDPELVDEIAVGIAVGGGKNIPCPYPGRIAAFLNAIDDPIAGLKIWASQFDSSIGLDPVASATDGGEVKLACRGGGWGRGDVVQIEMPVP
jgi:hypothetical protein